MYTHPVDESTCLTDKVVEWPCLSLWVMLLIPIAMTLLTLLRVEIVIEFDIANFEIKDTHFSQQRRMSMREAIKDENAYYTTRRRQLWTNPQLTLGHLELIYAPQLAVDLIDRPEMVSLFSHVSGSAMGNGDEGA